MKTRLLKADEDCPIRWRTTPRHVLPSVLALLTGLVACYYTSLPRSQVTESNARAAWSEYLEASKDVIRLYGETDCQATCLLEYFTFDWKAHPSSYDSECKKRLSRYGSAWAKAFGSRAPPYSLGYVFEYVLGNPAPGEPYEDRARVVEFDKTTIEAFEHLLADNEDNPIVGLVLLNYAGGRQTACCNDVTLFFDWLREQDLVVPMDRLVSPSWRLVQLAAYVDRYPELDEDARQRRRLQLMAETQVCERLEKLQDHGRDHEADVPCYYISDECPLVISWYSSLRWEIYEICTSPQS
jgi:hypothetical protein